MMWVYKALMVSSRAVMTVQWKTRTTTSAIGATRYKSHTWWCVAPKTTSLGIVKRIHKIDVHLPIRRLNTCTGHIALGSVEKHVALMPKIYLYVQQPL